MRPDPGEQIIFQGHPCWRAMFAFHVRGVLAAILAGAAAGLASRWQSGHVETGWVIVAVVVVFALALAVGALRRAATTYTLTDRRVVIERGVLGRSLRQTRVEFVMNVATRQTLRQRLLAVGTVSFDTAGAEGDFQFVGVARPRRLVRAIDDAVARPVRQRAWAGPVR
jgi:uncharacterized membrane protein YdbT with pleckstrin-like domain